MENLIPKFPFPVVTEPVESEALRQKQELEAAYWESRKKQVLSQSTKSLIALLREMRYSGYPFMHKFITEEEVAAELATRPHQRNKKERKEFVAKQQQRTERKTRGAR